MVNYVKENPSMTTPRLGMIGYGEVGRIFAAGLRTKDNVASVAAWDLKFASDSGAAAAAERAGIRCAAGAAELYAASDLIISAVTASSTLAVARQAARHIRPGSFFLDLNSASPGTKREAAALIEAAGAHYVEAGVMTSVPPYGIAVPMLLGGAAAETLAAILQGWDMDAKPVSRDIGVASAIKMCRSIMIKGLEALVIESYSTARHYGVEDQVLPTLAETFPQIDWHRQGTYFFNRVVQHGRRRAEEMRESAQTVSEAGYTPTMASAIASKQDWIAALAAQGYFEGLPGNASWQDFADRLKNTGKPAEE
jgi:3-hydroxyisobutyrate dehydrogenase-like beta-hydroxyacid dehydrogenase